MITLEEAITNLECLEQSEESDLEDDEKDALKLGIEALKRLSFNRAHDQTITFAPLPGETKE